MDRYATLDEYVAAKLKIFDNATHCVVPRNSEYLSNATTRSDPVRFGLQGGTDEAYRLVSEGQQQFLLTTAQQKIAVEKISLRGGHNLANALAALAVTDLVNVPMAAQARALGRFKGLEHRTELVGEWDRVRWINDSKGTNVGATVAALNGCIDDGNGILIAGGVGKGADFSPLKSVIATNTKAVILFGQDANSIAAAIGLSQPVHIVKDLAAAVAKAKAISEPGDAVLFSPACASFDMFSNYQERGKAFKDVVFECYTQ